VKEKKSAVAESDDYERAMETIQDESFEFK